MSVRAVAVALLLLGGCARARPPQQIVVLVSIDTLRADHLGCYGYRRKTSPALDRLAAEGTVFEDAMTPAPWTLPAHASLLTGLYPSRHGLKAHDRYLPASVRTLGESFARAGFVTAAVVNSQNLSPRFGLDRGFREFLYVEEVAGQRAPTRKIVDQAVAWLKRYGSGRLFLFVHSYDVHSDYASEPEYEREFVTAPKRGVDGTTAQLMAYRQGKLKLSPAAAPYLMDLYDAGIRQMDDELARLVGALRDGGLLDRTLFLLTSDHGEEFFEHGDVLHGRTQFQEVVRVPLVLRGPGIAAGRRISTPVSLIDVMPTLLSRLGVKPPEALDGEDLTRLLEGDAGRLATRVLFGEADHNNAQADVTRAVRRGSSKLVYDRLTEKHALYDLSQDAAERSDVAAARPELARELMEPLRRFLAIRGETGTPLKLSPEELQRLRSLGYLQ
jgi:arylsulfatase A-like enzyme